MPSRSRKCPYRNGRRADSPAAVPQPQKAAAWMNIDLGDFVAAQGIGRDTLGEVCRLEQVGEQQDGGGDA